MKSFIPRSVIAAAAALTLSLSASAVTLAPVSPINPLTNLTPSNGLFFFQVGNVEADDVETLVGSALQLTERYKENVGDGFDSGAFAASYQTVFSPTSEPKGATISNVANPIITGSEIYALAKDGSNGHYLWNITGWNGTDNIVMSGLWPLGQGSISHVSIFSGSGGNNTTVPDGGSAVALLGLGLASLAVLRRKLN